MLSARSPACLYLCHLLINYINLSHLYLVYINHGQQTHKCVIVEYAFQLREQKLQIIHKDRPSHLSIRFPTG